MDLSRQRSPLPPRRPGAGPLGPATPRPPARETRPLVTAAALILGLLVPLALAACGDSSPTSPATTRFNVTGTVTEAAATSATAEGIQPSAAGDPLEGARVEILDGPDAGSSATTDGEGRYTLAGVAASTVTIEASKEGFASVSKQVTVEAGTTVDFALEDTPSTLSGRVTESAPTEDVALSGALVEVVGGPHDGKSDTTGENGRYRIDDLDGEVTVRASKQGYEPRQEDLSLEQNQERDFALDPVEEQVEEVFRDSISGGTPTTCGDKPCKTFTVAVHHDGRLEAELTWTDRSNDLDLQLWRGDEMLSESDDILTVREFISADVQGGHRYELRVIYFDGSTIEEFELRVTHPS